MNNTNDWYLTESFCRPLEVDTTSSKKYVYIRKDITEITKNIESENTSIIYRYYERKMTHDEWSAYINYKQIDENTSDVKDLKEENQMLKEQIDMLTLCILEMSEAVYA